MCSFAYLWQYIHRAVGSLGGLWVVSRDPLPYFEAEGLKKTTCFRRDLDGWGWIVGPTKG